MILTLVREYLPTHTRGILYVGDIMLYTIEQPRVLYPHAKGGEPFKSCVPDGYIYRLVPHFSRQPHIGHTWAMVNEDAHVFHLPSDIPEELVIGDGKYHARYACLAGHIANKVEDVQGCFGLGISVNKDGSYIGNSKIAMQKYRAILGVGSTEHKLEITHKEVLVAEAQS